MIGHFPRPYPDELLYSICARFADRVQYSSTYHVSKELFGTLVFPGHIHFPGHLEHLISVLPPGHLYTTDLLINQHTLFLFYEPFLPPAVSPKIRENMRLSSSLKIQGPDIRVAGKRASQVSTERLRYCARCVEEERERFGECYWHRLHQILGVNVCPLHTCYLSNSEIPTSPLLRSSKLISAEQAIGKVKLSFSNPAEDPIFELQLAIAQDACWLLNRRAETTGLEALAHRYRNLLAERGLAAPQRIIRKSELGDQLSSYYPVDFLRRLFGEFIDHEDENWLIRPLQYRAFYHPVRHFLLMHFLGYTAEAFFSCATEALLFGKGPWPCLNPICQHYHKPRIEHCAITRSEQKKTHLKRPKGLFTCTCGFAYVRFGPDKGGEDQLRLSKVKTYGPIWEAALRRWWDNPSLTQDELARKLGVACSTLMHQAARLGLAFPRPGSRSTSSEKYKYVPHPRRPWVIDPEKLARYRKEWRATREKYPEEGISSLEKQVTQVYRWLKKHDSDWLKAHLPAQKSPCPPSSLRRADWEQRDKQWAIEIDTATLRLKELAGPPIRITRAAIARKLGQPKQVLSRDLEKLPLMKKALDSNLESIETFTVRRIRWAAACYREEHHLPTRLQLLKRSGTRHQAKQPRIQLVLDAVLRMLRDEEPLELLGDRIG